ncbi:MAG: Cytochrome c-type biosis protein [Bacteroidetes bacterium]|nr:Cytochrome c-type biosis protein [Bacteroidota bacterium]
MTVLGNLVVLLALIGSVLGTVQYYRAVSSASVLSSARLWVKLSGAAVIFASLMLLILLLRNDFTNGYVYSYSSRSLPLHFLISSFYAGQEGSFLFWALCAALISFVLMWSTRLHKNEAPVMAVYMGVQSFLLMLLFVKTPFISVWDKIAQIPAGQVPADGSGLNPLLQNFWMVIHPPVLFIGFAAMAVPFSFAVAGLWKKNYTLIATQGFVWVLGGVLVLGLGIMLGAYWAYGVLGWGGYWGWDPVENSSLVPWITGVALIHTILVQRRSQKFIRTSHFLALVSFILVVYSTFLTRSGVLGDSSVHSFTDPGATAYWLLMG